MNDDRSENRFRDGAPIDVLAEALDELRDTLQGVRNIGFTGDSRDVINYATNLLGPSTLAMAPFICNKNLFQLFFCFLSFFSSTEMITSEKRNGQQFIKPVTTIPNVIELSYYANSLVSHFVLDAIIISTATKLSQANEKQYPNTVSGMCSWAHQIVSGRNVADI